MQILHDLSENPNLSLALGYFDGVHIGHQAVIKNAVNFAKQNGGKSAVITFKDHPCCFFHGVCPKYILTREYREKFIADLGVDYLYELDFEKLAGLSAEEYLENILIKHFSPKSISTGFNHNFGHNKTDATVLVETPSFSESSIQVYKSEAGGNILIKNNTASPINIWYDIVSGY